MPLTQWSLVIDWVGDFKIGFASLPRKRELAVNYCIACWLPNKRMQAMKEREDSSVLWSKVQLDDADFGGQRNGSKAG